MKTIYTNHNEPILLDEKDCEQFGKQKWCLTAGYPSARINYSFVYLHRLIMQPAAGFVVDHINGNKLDNRRSNLRVCRQQMNIANKRMSKNNTSGFKGVRVEGAKFRAYIKVNRKQINLGIYNTAISASKAYERAARKYFGEFARVA